MSSSTPRIALGTPQPLNRRRLAFRLRVHLQGLLVAFGCRQVPPLHVVVGMDVLRTQMIARSILTPGLPALLFFLTSARAQVDDAEVGA